MTEAADKEEFTEQADNTRPILKELISELKSNLPRELKDTRIGDLSRHIHFLHYGDCEDILVADVPDILEKVEAFVSSGLETTTGHDQIGLDAVQLIDQRLRPKLIRELASEAPDYHGLLMKSSVILGDLFKSTTGASEHSDSEIGKIFKPDAPKLKVRSDTSGTTQRNFQRGAMLLLQGQLAFYRNTHAHEELEVQKQSAVRALVFFTSLIRMLESDANKKLE